MCIIHHGGLLPCFPGLFLPSMPVTLTESPNPLLLPTASLPPSGSRITSHFLYPFSHSPHLWAAPPLAPPSLHLYPHSGFFFFPRHFTTPCPRPSSVSCPSIIHISSPEHLGSTRCASLQSAVIACWAGVTAWLTCPRAQISNCLRAADALFAESSCNAGPTFQNYLQTACEISPVGGVFTRAWRGRPAPLWV